MANRVDWKVKLFLDSGAYSAWSQGQPIDIDKYIAFIIKHKHFLEAYSVLDVLDATGDKEASAAATFANLQLMESMGLSPLPCFHYNEPEKYLIKYTSGKYDYISLGGMVPEDESKLQPWLDRIFRDFICDSTGMPKVKVHGFGMTTHELIWRYPWFSIDSASWVFVGRNGSVKIPKKMAGKYNYRERPFDITFSEKSGEKKKLGGKHFDSLSEKEKEYFEAYLAEHGFALGESYLRDAKEGEEIDRSKDERWFDNSKKTIIETIVTHGVKTEYRMRDALNVMYYTKLGEALPEWPWKFRAAGPRGFGLSK